VSEHIVINHHQVLFIASCVTICGIDITFTWWKKRNFITLCSGPMLSRFFIGITREKKYSAFIRCNS